MPLTSLFINIPKTKLNLTQDQTRYFISKTVPDEVAINKEYVRNPVLNPDFQLKSTLIGFSSTLVTEFTDFYNPSYYNAV